MKLKHWTDLAECIGRLEGLSHFNDFKDFNREGVKQGILDVKNKLTAVFEAEREKLEDVNYKLPQTDE